MKKYFSVFLMAVLIFSISGTALASASTGTFELTSISSTGTQGNNMSTQSSISADGRFIAFTSIADNLVNGDTNGTWDVFVRDRQTGKTELISKSSTGIQGNGTSSGPSISADGRFVSFSSEASNLVDGDTNGKSDVFVHDRQTGITERASVSSNGGQANAYSSTSSISADGRYVAFQSQASNLTRHNTLWWVYTNIFVRDRLIGETKLVSVANTWEAGLGKSFFPTISADGRYIAYVSNALHLVPGDTSTSDKIFVYDQQTGKNELVNVTETGEKIFVARINPSISADGRYVAFSSGVILFVRDRLNGKIEKINDYPSQSQYVVPSISADGRYVIYNSGYLDVYDNDNFSSSVGLSVYDRLSGKTERISIPVTVKYYWTDSSLYQSISADGRYITFSSLANNLVASDTNGFRDIFVYDRLGISDTTAPTTTAYLSGNLGQNNWYTSDVQLNLTATDNQDGSGIAKTEYSFDNTNWNTYTTPFKVSTEGTTTVYYHSTDNAGNIETTKSISFKIDKTAPEISILTPFEGADYTLNQTVLASWSVFDLFSGISSATATTSNLQAIDTSTVGSKTYTVGAVDNAGNQATRTVTYNVRYVYSGFMQPFKVNSNTTIKLGSTIPLKFQLSDANGNPVTNAIARIYLAPIGTTGSEIEGVATDMAAIGNFFRYAGNHYAFNLNTKGLSAGTWQLRIELDDGSSHYATISIK